MGAWTVWTSEWRRTCDLFVESGTAVGHACSQHPKHVKLVYEVDDVDGEQEDQVANGHDVTDYGGRRWEGRRMRR